MRSYRASLGTVIGVLLLGLGALILGTTYFIATSSVRTLAAQQFREVSRRQVTATQAHLRAAIPALDALDAQLTDGLETAPPERVGRAFLGVLRANPGFSWVSYGDETGSFVGVYRRGQQIVLNRSAIRNGATELFEHEVLPDGSLKELRHVVDSGYDPRTRGWYAAAKREGRRVWTQPYVFFEQAVPGITCAKPHMRNGAVAGVLTIDFDLNALSGFVRNADLSENGTVVLFTRNGTLLAHPDLNVVSKTGEADQGTLLTVSDLTEPVMKTLVHELGQTHPATVLEGGVKLQSFRTKVDGDWHMASFTGFPVDRDVDWFVGAIAPESDFLRDVQGKLLVLFTALFLASLIATWIAANTISERFARQLRDLSGHMGDIGRLDLSDKPFQRTSIREIQAMQDALTNMKGGLRSFARYVPRDLVRRLVQSGREAVLGGETREMTVFFSDIEGFTTIAESMTPAELVDMLSQYLDEMTRIIGAHGGTVDKFLGDGILAFWGAPEADPDHAMHAAQAALECSAKLDELVASGAFGGRKLRARIGLASGPVLVGNIGTNERMNYTVMGDTANLAARLESLNKAYATRLLVSEETASRLKGTVFARPVDVVAVKGKTRGVKVYELLAKTTGKPSIDADHIWLVEASTLALDEYLKRDFAKAAATWGRILESRPGDAAATALKSRADAFVDAPPPAEWNGVNVAREK